MGSIPLRAVVNTALTPVGARRYGPAWAGETFETTQLNRWKDLPVRDLLDWLRELLAPRPRPVPLPVPVRNPQRPQGR